MDSNVSGDLGDTSIPLPPGVDAEELADRGDRRHHSYGRSRSRSSSRDHRQETENTKDKDYRRLYDRKRESRHDSRGSHSDDHRTYHDSDSSRGKDYESRRSYRDRSRDRLRDREKVRERDFREDIPNSTILVKGMGPHVTEDDIRNEITRYSLYPKDVILMRRKMTGESRGFAYVEFRLLSDAVRWKELTQGVLYFGQACATLHYFVPKDIPGSDRPVLKVDWTCMKCGLNNFRKRDVCFKCSAPREESEYGGEGCDEVSHSASSTLLFRNLDILTTEERVLSMLGQITVLPIKNLKVAKDSLTHTSRGFAYVELHSVSEATQLHDLLLSMAGNFYVDGRKVTVSYSRHSLSAMNSAACANAASVALAAAQWTNQDAATPSSQDGNMFSDSTIRERQMETGQGSSTDDCQKYSTPDVSTYQYDAASGYYYDASTGFYYDPNSQYYYNSQTRQYLYWDSEKQTYLSVPASTSTPTAKTEQQVVISSPPVIAHAPVINKNAITAAEKPKEKSSHPQDKVKIAKKVAKDMEKWAKTLNQKKESIVKTIYEEASTPPADYKKKSDDLNRVDPNRVDPKSVPEVSPSSQEKKSLAALVAAYGGGESDSEEVESESQDEVSSAYDLLKVEESKRIDWTKIACLLCKRQFPSKDVLSKHIQLSDLHRQNVDMLKLTTLSPKQLRELERKESGYRDRARERREKFGQPDVPPPSRLKTKYLKERRDMVPDPEDQPPAQALGADNIGNKMLKAMGWTEGQGLGKSGQGMSGIIEVQRRVKSAGLGMKGASYGASASDSYKDAVRKAMQARYNEIA